jgi:predicted dehydrogenase
MQTIQWGIIGCGDVTEVKSGPAFNKVPSSKLIAVMRRNAAKAKDYAQRHSVEKWYSNAEDLINDPDVNAIYIATPPLYHEAYTMAALKAGKPVYVEKPMAINAKGAKKMWDASQKSGAKLSVAHYRREQPLFKKIKEVLREGVIGSIRFVTMQFFQPLNSEMIAKSEVNWRIDPAISGGGLFHDLAPHQLDLMLYFFGTPKRVSGISHNISHLYTVDDTVSGQIVFENNVLFNGLWCFTAPQQENRDVVEIIGSKGKIVFSVFDHQPLKIHRVGEKEEIISFEKLEHVQQPMIQKVVDYFLDKSPNPCTAEDGVEVMWLIDTFTTRIESTATPN